MLRAAAWVCVVLLAVLSLVPGHVQIRTGAPGVLEHVVAYCGTATLLTAAYPATQRVLIAAGLICYAGVLELAQLYVPDRLASVFDFAGGSLGAVLGCAIGAFIARRFRSAPP